MQQTNPASWEANRHDAGLALLGAVWSTVFSGLAIVFEDETIAASCAAVSGVLGLVVLATLTSIGWRLAFKSSTPRAAGSRSDAKVLLLLGLGIALAVTIAVVIVVAVS